MLTLMGLHWMMLRRLINLIIIWSGQCGERGFLVVGGLFLHVYCGPYGKKGICVNLKGKYIQLFDSNFSCYVFCLSGRKLLTMGQRGISWIFWGQIINGLIPVYLSFFFPFLF